MKRQAKTAKRVQNGLSQRLGLGVARLVPNLASLGIRTITIEVKVYGYRAAALRSLILTVIYIRIFSR